MNPMRHQWVSIGFTIGLLILSGGLIRYMNYGSQEEIITIPLSILRAFLPKTWATRDYPSVLKPLCPAPNRPTLKLWSVLGYPKEQVPYYIRDPNRDHSFDKHSYQNNKHSPTENWQIPTTTNEYDRQNPVEH